MDEVETYGTEAYGCRVRVECVWKGECWSRGAGAGAGGGERSENAGFEPSVGARVGASTPSFAAPSLVMTAQLELDAARF